MQILIISPYHGGSHRYWAEGYQQASTHDVRLLTMPARFWKWRMHGGAITLARRFMARLVEGSQPAPDLIVATDMLDLTTFLALTRPFSSSTPVVLYMHENQLTYPLPHDPRTGPMRRQRGERDLHYAFINLVSMLAADRVLFNSEYHRRSLLDALPRLLKRFPEYNELGILESLREKSSVLPVGLDLAALGAGAFSGAKAKLENASDASLIIWNQRWEYDKDPATFFKALQQMDAEGIGFRLALCGERFGKAPRAFDLALDRLKKHIVYNGYADSETYRRLLWQADIVISTAIHEFFGISILEAIHCQTFPILPHGLSYPELIPEAFHTECLYEDEAGLWGRLRQALQQAEMTQARAAQLAPTVARFGWRQVAPRYDETFAEIVRRNKA